MNQLLETRNLSKEFRLGKKDSVTVLKEIDLSVRPGDFISIMGPSGSGKSTLLYNISGMDRLSSGSVVFNGRELAGLSERALCRMRLETMGFIFQQIHLLQNLNLFDNIVLSGYLRRKERRNIIDRRAVELMELTGISRLAPNRLTQASGGQLQRAGICRALINKPEILFGDEPTGALDSKSTAEIMELLQRINAAGTTIMLVSHDIKVAAFSKRVLYMIDGRITGEIDLGDYSGGDHAAQEREERLGRWIREQQ